MERINIKHAIDELNDELSVSISGTEQCLLIFLKQLHNTRLSIPLSVFKVKKDTTNEYYEYYDF